VSGVRSDANDASIPVGTRAVVVVVVVVVAVVAVVAVGDRGDRARRCDVRGCGHEKAGHMTRGGRSVVRTGPDSSQVELRECTTCVYVR
jgi:hypothetical protein